MRRITLIACLLFSLTARLPADEKDQTTSTQESEEKGIPVTPVTVFPEKPPYEQAKDELIQALDLLNHDRPIAACDMALEAYDDLRTIRPSQEIPRSKLKAEIYQAASAYLQACSITIRGRLSKTTPSPEAIQDAQDRLEDLREVARDYRDLNKKLDDALSSLNKK